MQQPKKLIEVAMPVKEISAESVRDKSIRHGHISTLHLWWARRPLPVCRAVVFASLVPDPLDEHCPDAFKDAVEVLLGNENNPTDPYKPYDDIPYTSVHDPMEDNLRNRLQMFIGKFSDEFIAARKSNRPDPPAGRLLSDSSLIKWDNKNDETIINKARKLIWVAYNAKNGSSANALLESFDKHFEDIRQAENDLYSTPDRHISSVSVNKKEEKLNQTIEAFLDQMPRVFDPFAGGGAIPLEAARLGCRSYGNDLNPVAHIIQKGSVEFPQKYGKPITYSAQAFSERYGRNTLEKWCIENMSSPDDEELLIEIPNRLAFDVEYYAKKLLALAEKEIGQYYPADEKGNKPIAYYWARVGTCSNPSCKAEVPLLKGFYLANTKNKQVHLFPTIRDKTITFEIRKGKYDENVLKGWNNRGNLTCPVCKNVTSVKDIKSQSINAGLEPKIIAVITNGKEGKDYRLPYQYEKDVLDSIPQIEPPTEKMQRNSAGGDTFSWGVTTWGQMFSHRQLLAMQTLVAKLHEIKKELKPDESEYDKAVITYLSILLDRVATNLTTFGLWKPSGEFVSSVFGRQAIPMVFDYPESNPFCNSSGSLLNQLNWILRYIESECNYSFSVILQNAASGDRSQFGVKFLNAVITDPPYYDAIAYADLSDFFYVWLKRTLRDTYPLTFATPQTPKTEECTALKHHQKGSVEVAKTHFENTLTKIFDAIERQTSDIVSIMFAHQTTEAWTTLCNSIISARMNISGSWPIDSEREVRAIALIGAALESSVTVSARPVQKKGYGDYKEVKKEILSKVSQEVDALYQLGFRGADLLTACFGQAVSVFGQYETVEKADGSEVTVAELLEMARESAFNALLKGFSGDEFTRFYIGWLQLYGFTESDFDDAAKFSRVGLSINVSELFSKNILIRNGNKQTLAGFEERLTLYPNLGERADALLIDKVHRAMALYKGTNRNALLSYLAEAAPSAENSFWRVITSLCEVLPAGSDDSKQANGLLTNKDSLLRDARTLQASKPEQTKLFE